MKAPRWFRPVNLFVAGGCVAALVAGLHLFVFTTYVLPSGSMAPTLLGDHFSVRCQTCGYPFAVAKREGEIGPEGERVDARCPLCGAAGPGNTFTFTARDASPGARMAVFKLDRKPRRWDVVVFTYPLDAAKTLVKRVVGLPGETLRIDARGDLWVKVPGTTKFDLARKPRDVQDALWMPVADARFRDPHAPAWKSEDDARWDTSSDEVVARPGKGDTWLCLGKQPRCECGYNRTPLAGKTRLDPAGDLRIRARVTPDQDARAVRLRLDENGRSLVAELAVGSGDVALLASGQEVARKKGVALAPGAASEVALSYADEHVELAVNGEPVLSWEDPNAFARTESSGAALGCAGPGGARFASVKIDRDIVYVPAGSYDPSSKDVAVPAESYFVLGDNSPNSQDSRVFGFVPEKDLGGRVFAALDEGHFEWVR
jgi:signal peptidase I